MIRFEDLADKVLAHYSKDCLDLIQRGYVASAKFHKGQVRMNGEPYLTHPLEVANILAELKMDPVTITAGLLHDVLEDTLMSPKTLESQFGTEVYQIVQGVTKISQIFFSSTHQKQAENFRKMLLAMSGDIRVVFVKLADRLHNMRTLQYLSPERRERISRETMDIYAPLSHRLGMAKVRGELEDLAFGFLDPVAYQNTVSLIERRRLVNQEFMEETEKAIASELQEHVIPVRLESRIKRVYGVYSKMRRQKISIDEVFDFIAIRVITDSITNCYTILGVLHNHWKPIPGRIKDYIAIPRPNLYQSLHTSVMGKSGHPFEIQIRTQEMHRIAEDGIAAHWKYKEGKTGAVEGETEFRWIRQLVDSQSEITDPHQFLSSLKVDLYPDEVYCFTPMGQVVTLPNAATPVDFAFSIHTEVGLQCVGAKVNSRIAALRHKLKNGEVVEILTSKNSGPSRDWLGFVKTAKARNKIRQWINQKERVDAAAIGQKLLEKESRKFKTTWKKILDARDLTKFLSERRLREIDDLYPAVGFGKVAPREILNELCPELTPASKEPATKSTFSTVVDRVLGRPDSPIAVKGQDGLLVYRAKCCNPIRGDEIVGYITRGKGVSVHTTQCRNLVNLLGSDRITEVQWMRNKEDEVYTVRLSISVDDRRGMLADITSAISNLKTNIRESRASSDEDGKGLVNVIVEINDRKHLQKVIQGVKEIPGIQDVERVSSVP